MTQLFAFNSPKEISWKGDDFVDRLFIFIVFVSKNPSKDIRFPMDGNLKADIQDQRDRKCKT